MSNNPRPTKPAPKSRMADGSGVARSNVRCSTDSVPPFPRSSPFGVQAVRVVPIAALTVSGSYHLASPDQPAERLHEKAAPDSINCNPCRRIRSGSGDIPSRRLRLGAGGKAAPQVGIGIGMLLVLGWDMRICCSLTERKIESPCKSRILRGSLRYDSTPYPPNA